MDRSPKQLVKNYLWIVLGCLVYALSFDVFFEPNEIAFGGVTGIAQIIKHFFPGLTIGVLVILFNVPLFLAGWKLFGRHMLVASLTAMGLSSVLIDLLSAWHPFPPMEDKLLSCIFGGILLGVGLGIIFLQGATTGGTEIVARLLKLKFTWLPMGRLLLFADLAVVTAVALVFRSVNTALYGVVALYVSTFVMDQVLYGLDNAKVAYIISDNPDEIAQVIMDDLDRSVTFLKGKGGYTGNEKKVILCAFKQRQIVPLKEAVRKADPKAFMIVTSAHEVLGEGFGDYQSEL